MNEIDFILEQLKDLTAIDSPTGFTEYAAEHVMNVYKKMGYAPVRTAKGGIFIDLGGKNEDDAILLTAHMDTLGAMVHTVKNDGRLKLTPLGGLNPNNTEGENCRIYTRGGRIYDGTFQLIDASSMSTAIITRRKGLSIPWKSFWMKMSTTKKALPPLASAPAILSALIREHVLLNPVISRAVFLMIN